MTEVLPFPDEVARDVRAWLYAQNISGLLDDVCAFTPEGLVDFEATFAQHGIMQVTEFDSRAASTDLQDAVWCVRIGEALTADEQQSARGRGLGQILLHHLAVQHGKPHVDGWLQQVAPLHPLDFAEEARDQIARHATTPKYLWGKFFPRKVQFSR